MKPFDEDSNFFAPTPTKPTDIGRGATGRFDRPESEPDIEPQPIARNTKTGRFGLDPFDLTSGGTGESVELFTGDGPGETFDFPEWTISRGQTYLNEKVYGEGREDLEPLRKTVAQTRPDESIELDRRDYDTFQRVVREGAERELEQLEGKEANIFGDAEGQRQIAREARRGIINNPPSFGGDRR